MRRRLPAGLVKHYSETTKHKAHVAANILRVLPHVDVAWWPDLLRRAVVHDMSKYRWDESVGFARVIFDLPGLKYGTPSYRAALDSIAPSIALHYERNRHHPEWHLLGVRGMSPVDRVEMVADWRAAVLRNDGDLGRSIEQNKSRFGYGEAMAEEFRRTARWMGAAIASSEAPEIPTNGHFVRFSGDRSP